MKFVKRIVAFIPMAFLALVLLMSDGFPWLGHPAVTVAALTVIAACFGCLGYLYWKTEKDRKQTKEKPARKRTKKTKTMLLILGIMVGMSGTAWAANNDPFSDITDSALKSQMEDWVKRYKNSDGMVYYEIQDQAKDYNIDNPMEIWEKVRDAAQQEWYDEALPKVKELHERNLRQSKEFRCKTTAEYANASDCWICDFFRQIFTAGNTLARKMFDIIASPLKKLAGIALALWILFQVGNSFLNFKGQNLPEMLMALGTMTFKFIVVFALLSGGLVIFDLFIGPLVDIATSYGSVVLSGESNVSVSCPQTAMITDANNFVIMNKTAYTQMCGLMNGMYQQVRKVLDLASAVYYQAWDTGTTLGVIHWIAVQLGIGFKLPNLYLLVVAFVIWLTYALVFITFPFMLLDSLFKMMMIAGFLPVFVVTWIFKKTRDYTTKAFSQLLACCIHLTVVAIVFRIMTEMLAKVLGGTLEELVDACANGNFAQVVNYLLGDQQGGFLTLLMLIGTGILTFMGLLQSSSITASLVGASPGSAGGSAFKAAVSTVGAVGAGAMAGKAAGSYLLNRGQGAADNTKGGKSESGG